MHSLFQTIQLKEELHVKVETFCQQWENGDDIRLETSGSTGKPKEITFTKQQCTVSALKTIAFFDLKKETKSLLCLSPDTIGGKMMMVRALVGNYSLVLTNPSLDPFELVHEQLDFVALVPAQLAHILMNPSSLSKLKKVKHILIGGADIPEELSQHLHLQGIIAYQSYGMTETISHVALREIGDDTTYHAMPGIHFTSQNDCLTIHYPEIQSKPIQTTDIVELIDEKSFHWKGRADNVINSGGKKIHPEELEKRLSSYISGRFILSSIPHPIWGEALVLLSELPITLKKETLIHEFLPVEIPKFAQTVPMIYTENGKIQRKLTLEQSQDHAWISL
ncbi:MAG: AMP-binding protein [Flavobacteriia bacterium]